MQLKRLVLRAATAVRSCFAFQPHLTNADQGLFDQKKKNYKQESGQPETYVGDSLVAKDRDREERPLFEK
jgi:hypothetical protein